MQHVKKVLLFLITLLFFVGCQSQIATPVMAPIPIPDVANNPIIKVIPELPGAFFVMVDDHPNARPQLNLEKADIVYEMICEWTITRYMAGFYTKDPGKVGPVRSARYYYAQAVNPYDTLYIHVGGNMDAMKMIKDLKLKDMCDITNASGYYVRDKNRKAPHNAYITTKSLLKYAKKKNYELKPLPDLTRGKLTGGRDINKLELTYGTDKYPHDIKWEYQVDNDRYLRYLNGDVFITASGNNIYADNLIIIEAPTKLVNVPVDYKQSEMNIIGKGRAIFLRNGKMYSGFWQKDSVNDHFTYRLDDGRMWVYSQGNVWIQQVHSLDENTTISFKSSQ